MAGLAVPREAKCQVAMKAETVRGTDVFAGTYTGTDILNCDSIRPDTNIELTENRMTAGFLGRAPSGIGAITGTIDFRMLLRGRGAAYAAGTLPEVSRPFRACMLSETLVTTAGAESVTYKPTDTEESYTIYFIVEIPGASSYAMPFVGCLGTVDFAGRAGGPAEARFRFTGAVLQPLAVTYVPATLSIGIGFPSFKSAGLQIGPANYAAKVATWSLGMNTTLTPRRSMNASTGLDGFFAGDRAPAFTFDPEVNAVSAYDWFNIMSQGTLQDLSFKAAIGTNYNSVFFQMNATGANGLQWTRLGFGARDGLMAHTVQGLPTIVAGQDEFAVVFQKT